MICKNCVYWWDCKYVDTRTECEHQKTYVQIEIEKINRRVKNNG